MCKKEELIEKIAHDTEVALEDVKKVIDKAEHYLHEKMHEHGLERFKEKIAEFFEHKKD